MTYRDHLKLVDDLVYAQEIGRLTQRESNFMIRRRDRITPYQESALKKAWEKHVEERYEETKKDDTPFGRFLRKYNLPFKEARCLLHLMSDLNNQTDFERAIGIGQVVDPFREHKVDYKTSKLKKHKLVFLIKDPYRPMNATYEVSYKAQLEIEGKPYLDSYQQLDLDLEEKARVQTPDELDTLYYLVKPTTTFQDLIVNQETQESLDAAKARAANAKRIMRNWGLGDVISYGRGTTLNFRGPPGTGKTMAAECLAKELGKRLLLVRYDQIQSMWLGQTEKHIQSIFKVARIKDAVLFFDEADALATKRSEATKSWQISQVNTLLKELERYEGTCIFATNFSENYDEAFERRLTMHIDFKLPDQQQGRQILERLLPQKSRAKHLTLKGLNLEKLSGGDLKNVILNAAGHAAHDNAKKMRREHLEKGILDVRNGKEGQEGNQDLRYLG